MTSADSRLPTLDVLRGFALFGILQVNIMLFASAYYGLSGSDDVPPWGVLVSLVFEFKFYLLFSFLFGYGVALQLASRQARGLAGPGAMPRRLIGLFVLGVAHGVLLYPGDILTTYAVLGALLLAAHAWPTRRRVGVAVVLTLASAALWLGIAALAWQFPEIGKGTAVFDEAEAALAAYRGTPMSVITQNVETLGEMAWVILLVQGPGAFAMFLLGTVAAARGLLASEDAWRAWLPRACRLGLAVGLPGAVFYAYTAHFLSASPWVSVGLAVAMVTAPCLTLGWSGLVLIALDRARGHAWALRLSALMTAAGRMSLTNYLAQSLACAFIFHAYGLALIDRVPLALAGGLGLLIYGAQMLASRWWLQRYRHGPVEWLLRAWTHGQLPPWRLPAKAQGD
ncbi:Methylcrotonyl-CoA carboxylase carboxyl transferase subunit [plant metagenome]|uniref:Methylcrotonyl-CoA carboxylase carboxyl transferase subunit n=1 Tax=plant metagenome TaxID=1297885 RepID=A0A484THQ4_9ZZZZ